MTGPVVLDASACVEFLLGTEQGAEVWQRLRVADAIHAPDLLVSEVAGALNGLRRGGVIADAEARQALTRLAGLGFELVSALPLAPQVWELATAHSVYDAHYVALARLVGGELLTCDAKLTRAVTSVPVCLVGVRQPG